MRPAAIAELDALLSASMIAHEAIFEMRRELVAGGRVSPEQSLLLEESARIVTEELPRLTVANHELVAKWIEQSLLDPGAAESTLAEFMAELERIKPKIDALLDRQRQIATRFRELLE